MMSIDIAQDCGCLVIRNHERGDDIEIPSTVLQHFHLPSISERMLHWQRIANGFRHRSVSSWRQDPFIYSLESISDGYVSLTDTHRIPSSDAARSTLTSSICSAVMQLHEDEYYCGFIPPQWVHFHPKTLSVIIDPQPFPSGFPFVNDFFSTLPAVLFSKHARRLSFCRASDIYAIGVLIHWIWTGEYPVARGILSSALPADISNLCRRLVERPESFISIAEIIDELDVYVDGNRPEPPAVNHTPLVSLNYCASPITERQAMFLTKFLVDGEFPYLAIVSDNDTARIDVVRQAINEVIELNYFITVACRNLPFATLREAIDRIWFNAERFSITVQQKKRALQRKLNQIVARYYKGDDVIQTLADWMYDFCSVVFPELQFQKLFVTFEHCEELDTESQAVFTRFWEQYHNQITPCQMIFTGQSVPVGFEDIPCIHVGEISAQLYERLVVSQCSKVDSRSLQFLVKTMVEGRLAPYYVRLVLESLIERGQLMLDGYTWRLSSRNDLTELISTCTELVGERVQRLFEEDRQLLHVLCHLPAPVRIKSIYEANEKDTESLITALGRLFKHHLLLVFHEDSIAVPSEVSSYILECLENDHRILAAETALALHERYRPDSLPSLIQLARASGKIHKEYLFLILYYRQVRFMLSEEAKCDLLMRIERLQKDLGRHNVRCWTRLLAEAYYNLNRVEEAASAAGRQYQQTGELRDRFLYMRYKMFANDWSPAELQEEAFTYVSSPSCSIQDRVQAAGLVLRSDFYLPMNKQMAIELVQFYEQVVFPSSSKLTLRMFADFTISFSIFLFLHFPEKEEYASVLLDMLDSLLSDSSLFNMTRSLNDAYIFHSNVTVCRKHLYRQLEQVSKTGNKLRTQIAHLNGMELALYQGDVGSYHHHKQHAVLVGDFRRLDLREQFLIHQLNYACEWEQWEEFDRVLAEITTCGMNSTSQGLVSLYRDYAAYRRKRDVEKPLINDKSNHYDLFVNALHDLTVLDFAGAQRAFEEIISIHGYHITAGWSYRELIQLLLAQQSMDTRYWLTQFEAYLKKYCFDVFWPDYYYLMACWHLQSRDVQRGLLYLRRAVNGYQMIGKSPWFEKVTSELAVTLQPNYLEADSDLRKHPVVGQLLSERTAYLNRSLDLLVVIDMAEQVTESLDVSHTFRRMADGLFEYFPITTAVVAYNLSHRNERVRFSSSGVIANSPTESLEAPPENILSYDLYRQNQQSITLELYTHGFWETTTRRHLLHFLSVIKPHIANTVHYLEMMLDNLTGFYQRRYLVECLQREFETSQKYGLDLSVMMLDIDNFRRVNEHGHPEGDRVIRELAQVIKSLLREIDIPVRYGGEEFLIILPKTPAAVAVRIANLIRRHIEEWFASHKRAYHVTVSIGVSSLRTCNVATYEELVSCADAAEIQAKSQGKNQVICAWEC